LTLPSDPYFSQKRWACSSRSAAYCARGKPAPCSSTTVTASMAMSSTCFLNRISGPPGVVVGTPQSMSRLASDLTV
jgi:hypothetical protein